MYIHAYIYTYTYVHMYIYARTHAIHIYTYTYVHMYIYARTHTPATVATAARTCARHAPRPLPDASREHPLGIKAPAPGTPAPCPLHPYMAACARPLHLSCARVSKEACVSGKIHLLVSKRDLLVSKRDLLVSKIHLLVSKRDLLVSKRDLLVSKRDLLVSKRDLLMSKRSLSTL